MTIARVACSALALCLAAGEVRAQSSREAAAAVSASLKLDRAPSKGPRDLCGDRIGVVPDRDRAVSECAKSVEPAFLAFVERRVDKAIEAAKAVPETPQGVFESKLMPAPDLGAIPAEYRERAIARYEEAVAPLRDRLTEGVVDFAEEAFQTETMTPQLDFVMKTFCSKPWHPDKEFTASFQSSCREGIATFRKKACESATKTVNLASLGHSKTLFADKGGEAIPIDFDAMVCAAASDGFLMEIRSEGWIFKDHYLVVQAGASDVDPVVVPLVKETRAGSAIWIAGDPIGARSPFTTSGQILECLATTAQQAGTESAVGLLVSGFASGTAASYEIKNRAQDRIECIAWKHSWQEGKDMKSVSNMFIDGLVDFLRK